MCSTKNRIIYNGPVCALFRQGKTYPIYRETDFGWIIRDEMEMMTNVLKRNNLYWEEV